MMPRTGLAGAFMGDNGFAKGRLIVGSANRVKPTIKSGWVSVRAKNLVWTVGITTTLMTVAIITIVMQVACIYQLKAKNQELSQTISDRDQRIKQLDIPVAPPADLPDFIVQWNAQHPQAMNESVPSLSVKKPNLSLPLPEEKAPGDYLTPKEWRQITHKFGSTEESGPGH